MLQGPYKYLRNWDAANQGGANMMTDSSQAVLSIAEFNKMIGSDDLTIFSNRMRVLEMARSLRIMPIDAESEKFQYVERSFQGVFEMIDRAAQALAGAVGIPQTIYFGRAPAGLNATGESDTRGWYDKVRAQREAKYQPLFEQIIQIIAKAEGLQYPDQWGVSWPSLWQETAKEKADTDKTVAETDKLYLDMGAITEDEIAETRFGGDEFQRGVIQVDLESREILRGQDLQRAQEGVLEEGAGGVMAEDPEAVDPQTALNGAQVKAMQEIVLAVAAKDIPRETGVELIVSAFPVNRQQAESIMGEVGRTFFSSAEEPEEPNPFEEEGNPKKLEEGEENA
jgi:hypothetical protein